MAIAAVAAFNVNLNTNQKSELSLLALANVEALAQYENNDYRKVEKSVTSTWDTNEVINGVNMSCTETQTDCPGTGETYCRSSYSKICS